VLATLTNAKVTTHVFMEIVVIYDRDITAPVIEDGKVRTAPLTSMSAQQTAPVSMVADVVIQKVAIPALAVPAGWAITVLKT